MKFSISDGGIKKPIKLESRNDSEVILMGEYDSIEEAHADLKIHLGLPAE